MYEKLTKIPEFYMILARKISKIPEFLLHFPEKKLPNFTGFLPEFYILIAQKYFSRILGDTCPPALPSPTHMARSY